MPDSSLILDILPPPFEWCDIPAGRVALEDNAGTFDIAPFRLAKYPVTYAQFQVFIDAKDGFDNPAWREGLAAGAEHWKQPGDQEWKIDNHPRDTVSWYQAVAFCGWLSHRVGYEVRLPAEWEWQWAAQGPDGRKFPWGNEFDATYCNSTMGRQSNGTTPVDAYPQGAGPYGVLDMAGNVWEWCLNAYESPQYTDLESDVMRAVRGGSWLLPDDLARAGYRDRDHPFKPYGDRGFRLARSL